MVTHSTYAREQNELFVSLLMNNLAIIVMVALITWLLQLNNSHLNARCYYENGHITV